MTDKRPGVRPPTNGPNVPSGIRRRPAFRPTEGGDVEADNALDAARASGDVRGDLRGTPQPDAPGTSYVTRRNRAPLEERLDEEQAGETQQGMRGARQSARDPRLTEDRQFSEDRELTDDERVAMLRQGFFQVALPDLPKKSGVHRVWLTTTNQRDPIAARLRAGYRLLRIEDLGPGWEQQKSTSGEHPGTVMVNEMIAAEISEALYQRFMHELHHNMPKEAERGIYGRLDAHNAALVEKGSRIVYEDEEENAIARMRDDRRRAQAFE